MPATVSAEKAAVVAEVRERLAASSAVVVTEYRGMTVGALAKLRRALRNHGAEYSVYKNTLARFGAREAGLADLEQFLVGPTAITFVSGDASAVAKTLRDHAKENPVLVMKGGIVGGKPVDARMLAALADLPPREVLLAQLAGALQAPLVKTAGLLQAPMSKFAYAVRALVESREAA